MFDSKAVTVVMIGMRLAGNKGRALAGRLLLPSSGDGRILGLTISSQRR